MRSSASSWAIRPPSRQHSRLRHEFLAAAGVQLPDHLDIVIVRGRHELPPVLGKFGPDFEFFSIRQFDCRTYRVAKVDEEGKIVGYEEVEICRGFEITPRFCPRGPIS